jgi:hypothetical protein
MFSNYFIKLNKKVEILLLITLFLFSCNKGGDIFEVVNFKALSNCNEKENEIEMYMDYQESYTNGFIIPSVNQTDDGFFHFSFDIKNNSNHDNKFYYKIYYQNESYKFPDEHPFVYENFYGSWEDTEITFVETDRILADNNFHTIKSKFRIVGNPRNEAKFFGSDKVGAITKEEYEPYIASIKSSPEWLKMIKEKAKNNQYSTEDQIYMDAVYMAKIKRDEGDKNNRWKRNPRVGEYKFLLVVVSDSSTLSKIPQHIKNISLLDSNNVFSSPFAYFNKTTDSTNLKKLYSEQILKLKAKPSLNNGIYINNNSFIFPVFDTSSFTKNCNNSTELLHNSCIEQFITTMNKNFRFNNIPVVADVHGGNYTKNQYSESLNKTHKFVSTPIETTNCPCKNIFINNKSITLKNPSTKVREWKKENTGIITRHGFTYGKYRVKAKLPKLLNKDNVWNGLTNAIWLINQNENWNKRRSCNKNGGYVPKTYRGEGDFTPSTEEIYSEIDIEIVKASRYWPQTSYGEKVKKALEPISDTNQVIFTYTNWDLGCQEPDSFNNGVFNISHNNNIYSLHRWDSWFQAVTGKYVVSNEELFGGDYYWFEIEWKPEEIIWRIGPEKNQLREVGYVNSTYSSIPNNQMLLIITQEWHLEDWWPEAPFNQNYIPFPLKEITGEVLEIEIE